ncbi:membrane protein [Ignatzschineria indica]|uniref:DUF1622 domain-containing protein n=1 Tax=Ignatzschineria indica TaxID=472583 RepID=A0A2U2AI22_9GAMM|nr:MULTISPECIES: DUF1622 domain-containing protein [Ignatzschineria]OYQ77545.1 hypothetical protein B9T19_09490 [Ignatzschineria sp. F8392]PWD82281.1 DUF1622 domain-containing protein [Ignatzschineria indica]GGZ87570.1 membrane protein [Ignatzschineria indica]
MTFHSLEWAVELLVDILNGFSILVLLIGVIKAAFGFIRNECSREDRFAIAQKNNGIKVYLGSYILLSLEILIASDIIETIMNPSIDDMLILGGIVVIRTAISYFLGKEIEAGNAEREEAAHQKKEERAERES